MRSSATGHSTSTLSSAPTGISGAASRAACRRSFQNLIAMSPPRISSTQVTQTVSVQLAMTIELRITTYPPILRSSSRRPPKSAHHRHVSGLQGTSRDMLTTDSTSGSRPASHATASPCTSTQATSSRPQGRMAAHGRRRNTPARAPASCCLSAARVRLRGAVQGLCVLAAGSIGRGC